MKSKKVCWFPRYYHTNYCIIVSQLPPIIRMIFQDKIVVDFHRLFFFGIELPDTAIEINHQIEYTTKSLATMKADKIGNTKNSTR